MTPVKRAPTCNIVGFGRKEPCDGVLGMVGNTPLVRLNRYLDRSDVELYAKLECQNPGGSAKDRPARLMIESALKTGDIGAGTTVIESSSGNMGIGLAQICRVHDLRFICVVDPNAQPQNIAMMRALGAEVRVVTKPFNGDYLTARLAKVRQLVNDLENTYWPNQYGNLQNPLSHQLGTVREIDAALKGRVDDLFVATSSTGTVRGCCEYLRGRGLHTKVTAVDAVGSVLFDGVAGRRRIPGLGAGQIPALARDQHFQNVERVTDIDCVVGCRRLAEREALLVGGSAGGVLETIRRNQHQLPGRAVVAVLHDSGTRYLDTVFDDAWVEGELGITSEELGHMVRREPSYKPIPASA